MLEELALLLGEAGGGFVLGFVTGYAAKRIAKLAVIVLGTGVVLGYLAESAGFAKIEWSKVEDAVSGFLGWLLGKIAQMASQPIGLGFALGFLVGITR